MARTVIVGGVAAGMSAATRLRRLDERAEIVVLEAGPHVSFANCGLPYHVGGVIEQRDSLLLQTPESLAARFALDVRTRTAAIDVDAATRTVTTVDVETGETAQLAYDQLVLAPGTVPSEPMGSAGVPVVTLRTVGDVDRIIAVLDALAPDRRGRAVVAGGGFIGLEAVENLVRRGLDVTLVHRGAHPLSPLDDEMAQPVLDVLVDHGIAMALGRTIEEVGADGVVLDDGERVACDLVIDARGAHPQVELARRAGVRIGPTGGIAVDGLHTTSDPHVLAAGDAVEKLDAVDHAPTLVTLAGLANRHGRAVADVIAWRTGASSVAPEPATTALGTAIVGVLGRTVAMVGWSERRLRAAGRAHRVVHTHPTHHAGYYPGAEQMATKLLVDATDGTILGAQIVGGAGVDKRIDVIATAMHAGLAAAALADLELAYAPQYGSAKDPVNVLGMVAQASASGRGGTIQWHELDDAIARGWTLVDVRSAAEHEAGAIPGAVLLPLDELRARHGELGDAPLIVHCQVGQRGHTAASLLAGLGHEVRNLDGGYRTWIAGSRARERATMPVGGER